MATTQDFVIVENIRDNMLFLKDGGMALVLQTSAVNFGLLSEMEQLAIISAFASFLNSLSFSIQILIRSRRLDISSYIGLLNEAQTKQSNPLLIKMMAKYRSFIEKTVKDNNVLDKRFYIVIPLSYLELGITKNVEGHLQKALSMIIPRSNHVIRQLARIGLKATQLTSIELLDLFYDIYNPSQQEQLQIQELKPKESMVVAPSIPKTSITTQPLTQIPQIEQQTPIQNPAPQIATAAAPTTIVSNTQTPNVTSSNLVSPFIVEELADDYGSI